MEDKWKNFIIKCESFKSNPKLAPHEYNKILDEIHSEYEQLKVFIPQYVKLEYLPMINEILQLKKNLPPVGINFVFFDESNLRSFTKKQLKYKTPLGGYDVIKHIRKGKRPFVGPFKINGRDYYLPVRTIHNRNQLKMYSLYNFSDRQGALFCDDPCIPVEKNKLEICNNNEKFNEYLLQIGKDKSKIIEKIKKYL